IIRGMLWPSLGHARIGQVGSDRYNTLWQVFDRTAQAAYLPATGEQLAGQPAADITTTYDQYGTV
ncbi:hypothetical protein NL323_28140, partial [Klebsiella pneumoniae]|nr:hypothetical protein [Klebsiella pneumoniae]